MTVASNHYREASMLLVDDDDVDVMGINRALKKLGIGNPVIRAHDGQEALTMLRTPGVVHRPCVIILDINMPRMNGLEMLAELRKDPLLTRAVVFVLTTSRSDEDKMAAYAQHIAGYIVKTQVGDGFSGIINMLDRYWQIVDLPLLA